MTDMFEGEKLFLSECSTPGTAGHQLRFKILDTTGSLQW
jgi:hypothetical protein